MGEKGRMASKINQAVSIFVRLTDEATRPWALSPPSVFPQESGDKYTESV